MTFYKRQSGTWVLANLRIKTGAFGTPRQVYVRQTGSWVLVVTAP